MFASVTCAFLQHLQREQEFLAELLLAAPEIRLRGERADRAVRQLRGAVVGLARPDRQHDRARHADSAARFASASRDAFSASARPCAASRSNADSFRYSRGRLHEFRLRGLAVRPARDHEIGQRKIRLEAARRRVERRARHAALLRIGPQRLDEPVERRIGRGRGRLLQKRRPAELRPTHARLRRLMRLPGGRMGILADLLHVGDADRRQNEDDSG